jgi:hypothetical protein
MQPLILDILYQVLVSPSKAFSTVTRKKPWHWALLIATSISLIFAFDLLPNPPQLVEVILGLGRGTLRLAPVVSIWVLMFLAVLIVMAGLFHVLALLFRGKGSYLGILCGVGFASFPAVFVGPLALLRAFLSSASGQTVYFTCCFILSLWILTLCIIAVHHNYNLSPARAAAACLIPVFLVIVLPPLVVALYMAS